MRNSIVYFCLLVCCITVRAEELKLWYSHPAEEWVEALPLGIPFGSYDIWQSVRRGDTVK